MNTPTDRALLERALIAIEQVMARPGMTRCADGDAGTPAAEAMALCLTSAAALVDVAQMLLRDPPEQSPDTLSQDWQALIGHTKNASRTAHQAVLVLCGQRNLVTAQDGITLSNHLPVHAAGQASH